MISDEQGPSAWISETINIPRDKWWEVMGKKKALTCHLSLITCHCFIEPSLRHAPLAHHRSGRQLQGLCRFLDAQSAEETQLDNPAFPLVNGRQTSQRVVQRDQVCGLLLSDDCPLIERHLVRAPSPLSVLMTAGVIDEDASHQLRGDGEEVCTVLPVHVFLIDQPEIRFVNK